MSKVDDELFREAFVDCFPRAVRAAKRVVGDPVVAEDIAADAMVQLFRHWTPIGGCGYRDAWVVRVTTNLALNHVRRRRLPLPVERVTAGFESELVSSLVVRGALVNLSEKQRGAVELCKLQGFTEVEAGEVLQVSSNTVKTHLRRALRTLQTHLDQKGVQ